MLEIDTPGFANLQLEHLVLDFNGTLAVDGNLLPQAAPLLRELSKHMRIHVLTADTFGRAKEELSGLPAELNIIGSDHQDDAKLAFITALGAEAVAAIGNGRNDRKMLCAAALGIAVMQAEGAAHEAIANADIVVGDIGQALQLLLNPMRLTATLRS